MKKNVSFLISLLFLSVFLTGATQNLVFFQSHSSLNYSEHYFSNNTSADQVPFFFQPIEDASSENDDEISDDYHFNNHSLGLVNASEASGITYASFKQKLYQGRIWCRNCNLRL